MAFCLGEVARAAGHRLHVHESLGSTNAEALDRARDGETGPLWIVAHRQDAGRGRRGSAWVSPEGNLAATLLWPLQGVAPDRMATLGFVAGLALVQALEDVAARQAETRVPSPVREMDREKVEPYPDKPHPSPQPSPARERAHGWFGYERVDGTPFRLKWPNDVVVDGAKLAGLLLEAEGRRSVAIGFGVNVNASPEGLPYPATALACLGIVVDAATLLDRLSGHFVEVARVWKSGHGFPAIREQWLAYAHGLGAPIAVHGGGTRLEGIFEGIDEEGRLVILAPDGSRRTVTAGEVHFGEAATAA